MKYCLSRLFIRNFSTYGKSINKFKNVSSKININPPSIPKDIYSEDKELEDKTPPKPGEYYPLEEINSKGLAMQLGRDEMYNRDPVSAYYTLKIKDTMYHVFNAARMPLGRMCAKVAFIIQGKNSPHYRPNKVDYRDKCIIVNAKNVFLTGKKLEQKLYRHHSGYPGGLKEIKARLYLQKNATEMVMRSIKGMIPKNKMRPEFLSKVKIYEEGGHDLTNLGLPQFGKIKPIDYNEVLQTKISPETHVIVGHTGDLDKHFPHLKDYKRELSMEAMLPRYMHKPEFKVNIKKKERLDNYLRSFRQKHHRRIRNMAYRYI